MGIQFTDLSGLQQAALSDVVGLPQSDPVLSVKVWFEGMDEPIAAEGVDTGDGVVLRTTLPFLRLNSPISLAQSGVPGVEHSGLLTQVVLKAGDQNAVPRLQLEVAKAELVHTTSSGDDVVIDLRPIDDADQVVLDEVDAVLEVEKSDCERESTYVKMSQDEDRTFEKSEAQRSVGPVGEFSANAPRSEQAEQLSMQLDVSPQFVIEPAVEGEIPIPLVAQGVAHTPQGDSQTSAGQDHPTAGCSSSGADDAADIETMVTEDRAVGDDVRQRVPTTLQVAGAHVYDDDSPRAPAPHTLDAVLQQVESDEERVAGASEHAASDVYESYAMMEHAGVTSSPYAAPASSWSPDTSADDTFWEEATPPRRSGWLWVAALAVSVVAVASIVQTGLWQRVSGWIAAPEAPSSAVTISETAHDAPAVLASERSVGVSGVSRELAGSQQPMADDPGDVSEETDRAPSNVSIGIPTIRSTVEHTGSELAISVSSPSDDEGSVVHRATEKAASVAAEPTDSSPGDVSDSFDPASLIRVRGTVTTVDVPVTRGSGEAVSYMLADPAGIVVKTTQGAD